MLFMNQFQPVIVYHACVWLTQRETLYQPFMSQIYSQGCLEVISCPVYILNILQATDSFLHMGLNSNRGWEMFTTKRYSHTKRPQWRHTAKSLQNATKKHHKKNNNC